MLGEIKSPNGEVVEVSVSGAAVVPETYGTYRGRVIKNPKELRDKWAQAKRESNARKKAAEMSPEERAEVRRAAQRLIWDANKAALTERELATVQDEIERDQDITEFMKMVTCRLAGYPTPVKLAETTILEPNEYIDFAEILSWVVEHEKAHPVRSDRKVVADTFVDDATVQLSNFHEITQHLGLEFPNVNPWWCDFYLNTMVQFVAKADRTKYPSQDWAAMESLLDGVEKPVWVSRWRGLRPHAPIDFQSHAEQPRGAR